MGLHDWACVHEGGGRWVGSNKVVELKKKKIKQFFFFSILKKYYSAATGLSSSMWDLVSWPGIEPGFPALGAWNLSHWTTREVPKRKLFYFEKTTLMGKKFLNLLGSPINTRPPGMSHSECWCLNIHKETQGCLPIDPSLYPFNIMLLLYATPQIRSWRYRISALLSS